MYCPQPDELLEVNQFFPYAVTTMRFANLEIVKLLKPRLGFGSPEAGPDPVELAAPVVPPVSRDDLETGDDTQLSLLCLADELETALKSPPKGTQANASTSLRELATIFDAEPPPALPEPTLSPKPDLQPPVRISIPISKGLEGCKVAAIGFGRQDISGLATTMIDRRARIEFLPRGEKTQLADFDLLLINAASAEILKREAADFREILALGIPSIVIGSRSALTVLRDSTDPQTWDFTAKPIHLDELAWRATSLLSRNRTSSGTRRMPARVVVADADAFTRTLIESAMTQLDVECTLTDDGEAAWKAIEESNPGAVIVDLTLPNRDGFQLMADIRRSTTLRKPKIIVLSARQSEADILRAFSLGADDYITKPFSPLELSARLTRLLGGVPDHG